MESFSDNSDPTLPGACGTGGQVVAMVTLGTLGLFGQAAWGTTTTTATQKDWVIPTVAYSLARWTLSSLGRDVLEGWISEGLVRSSVWSVSVTIERHVMCVNVFLDTSSWWTMWE